MNTPFKKRESPLSFNTTVTQQQEPTPTVVHQKTHKISNDNDKVKYTAVMDKNVRVRIKIAAASKNIQISQFIEEAVLEKLEREGF